jgi:hypothetical protein
MALVAQALVASILALEAGVVFWLPRQARAAAFWEKEILQQRTTWQLDHLRSINRPGVEEAELERAARLTVARELDALAVYLRQYEDSLTREEWARILTDLQGYGLVLDRLGRRQAFQPLPALDVEAGVLAVLSAHDAKPERK